MRARHLAIVMMVLASAPVAARQQAAPAVATTPVASPSSAKIWVGRHAEFEAFLRTAPFIRFEDVPIGVTRPRRGYFEPGGLVASAAWKMLPPGRSNGYWESYKAEIAAYELDKLLGLDMVPPAVEKRVRGERGAAVLWLKPVRSWKEAEPQPKPPKWNREAIRMKMFDNLIGNIDRNAGNLLVDDDWNLFLIDHSRAFVSDPKLRNEMARIDREIWDRMLALDEPTLAAALGPWLDRGAIRAILKRRDAMKKVIDTLVTNSTEALVFIK
ncbi:MAG TPA: hypothetical protein VJ813_07340 [Vicinamibacterales bacterium]|nr:hypothetical protein [Vicinamibacterales bacterium]